MRLVVAEKPSVARDIARVLNAKTRGEGFLQGGEYVVTWAIGHLVSLCEPDELNPEYKKWRMDMLPILPDAIPLKVLPATKSQFAIVKRLMNDKDTESIVCATDSGREGELIFRYVYQMARCKKPVSRLWISSMTDAAIREGFQKLRPDAEYDALYVSAQLRGEADWLVGMNASRAFTIKFGVLLSVGRVQTPTLAMIVSRDTEIARFVPEDYWEITADFGDYTGLWLDPESKKTRCLSAEKAEAIKQAVSGQTAVVREAETEEKRVPPDRLYDLTTLQREANRRYGYSAQKTLSVAQALYETHKLITYPRTDSRYLPEDMIPKIEKTLRALPAPYDGFVNRLTKLTKSARLYDGAKVSDHHAIVPTEKRANLDSLKIEERNLYDMIVRKLIAAHYPDYVYLATRVMTEAAGHLFKTTGNTPVTPGWRELYAGDKDKDEMRLPALRAGDTRKVKKTSVKALKTKPPAAHTDDSLLSMMENAGKTIEDEALREQMKASGLGTPATRASMIERLIQVGYASRKGKSIVSTEKGRLFISVAPDEITSAATTGKWERALAGIAQVSDRAERTRRAEKFGQSIRRFSVFLVDAAKNDQSGVRFPAEQYQPRRAAPKGAARARSGKGVRKAK